MNMNNTSKLTLRSLKTKDHIKAEIANKKLTNLLTNKMFQGYCNIKKWNKIKKDPRKMKKLIQSVEDQNYNPFADNYNLYYKTNVIGSLFPQIDFNPSIEINSAAQMRTASTPQLNQSKLFLTYEEKMGLNQPSKEDINKIKQLNSQSQAQAQAQSSQQVLTQSHRDGKPNIYLDNTEENVYSKFPFIIINRNQEEDYVTYPHQHQHQPPRSSMNKSLSCKQRQSLIKEKQKDSIMTASQSEFLFRISHKRDPDPTQYQMSFYHNKGLNKGKSMNSIFQNDKLKEQHTPDTFKFEITNGVKQPIKKSDKPLNRIAILQKGINEVFESIENFEMNLRVNDFFEDEDKDKEKAKVKKDNVISSDLKADKPIKNDFRPKSEQMELKPKRIIIPYSQRQANMKKKMSIEKLINKETKEILKKQKQFHFSLDKEDSVTKVPDSKISKIFKKHSTIRDNQILSALYQNFDQKDIAHILGSTRLMFNSLSQEKMILQKKRSFVN